MNNDETQHDAIRLPLLKDVRIASSNTHVFIQTVDDSIQFQSIQYSIFRTGFGKLDFSRPIA